MPRLYVYSEDLQRNPVMCTSIVVELAGRKSVALVFIRDLVVLQQDTRGCFEIISQVKPDQILSIYNNYMTVSRSELTDGSDATSADPQLSSYYIINTLRIN